MSSELSGFYLSGIHLLQAFRKEAKILMRGRVSIAGLQNVTMERPGFFLSLRGFEICMYKELGGNVKLDSAESSSPLQIPEPINDLNTLPTKVGAPLT